MLTRLPCARSASLRVQPGVNSQWVAEELLTTGEHEYFRPSGDQVSGFPTDNTAAYHRSPCPALNSLANHGHIPRDGKQLTPEILHQALRKVFNLDDGLATRLTQVLPVTLTLADLSVHGFIEHDASLVHDDTAFKRDPSQVNETLADALFASASSDAVLTKRTMAHARRRREAECARDDPQYALPAKAQVTAYGEAAILLLGMGDYATETISVAHARSFLVDERIPADFSPAETPISTSTAFFLAAQIKLLASLSTATE
ncbi:hypothetical protein BBJ28_00003239 [Nothophytophthora sp. Chile5]|nr:hypothetical protein BBJ28_00003239 [Nothophytophthora sp. Chile5]